MPLERDEANGVDSLPCLSLLRVQTLRMKDSWACLDDRLNRETMRRRIQRYTHVPRKDSEKKLGKEFRVYDIFCVCINGGHCYSKLTRTKHKFVLAEFTVTAEKNEKFITHSLTLCISMHTDIRYMYMSVSYTTYLFPLCLSHCTKLFRHIEKIHRNETNDIL